MDSDLSGYNHAYPEQYNIFRIALMTNTYRVAKRLALRAGISRAQQYVLSYIK